MAWPDRLEVSEGQNICRDPIYSVESPAPVPPREDWDPETHTYHGEAAVRGRQDAVAAAILDELPGEDPGYEESWALANTIAERALDAALGKEPA